MKERRSIESWRIASVWPSPPKITSWWATRPGSRTEWIGSWTLPPAASISSAVRFAVPEGASSLRSWCSSTISHSGMCAGDRLRDLHQQHGADREVGGDEAVGLGAPRRPRAARRGRSRWCRRRRGRPAAEAGADVAERRLGSGEVDDDVGLAEHLGRARPRAPGRPGRPARCPRRPRPPRRPPAPMRPAAPDDGDPDHAATRASLTGASAARKRSSSAPTQAAESRSAP